MLGDPKVSELEVGEEVTFPEGAGLWVGDMYFLNPGPGTKILVWIGGEFSERECSQ